MFKLKYNHPDAYKHKKQDVCERLVNLRESVCVTTSIGSQLESDDESSSLDVHINEDVYCDIDDEDSRKERHIDQWTNAYISQRNGLKMKISRKRKHEDVPDGSDDKTIRTSPLNTPLPLPRKVEGLSPLNTPLSKNINGTSPLNTPLPKKTKHNVI